MMNDHFRQALEECDVALVRKLWAHVSPHLPQPKTDHEALITIHVARTAASTIAFKLRAYSHRWLIDNGYPSQLPDELKPKAERIYPSIADAVGVSVRAGSPERKPLAEAVEKAMSDAVAESYADGKRDPLIVKERMREARIKILRG